jgi:hypothetical protein
MYGKRSSVSQPTSREEDLFHLEQGRSPEQTVDRREAGILQWLFWEKQIGERERVSA